MFLTVDVLEVDVLELDVLGARQIIQWPLPNVITVNVIIRLMFSHLTGPSLFILSKSN
jgi:hypothetical protein